MYVVCAAAPLSSPLTSVSPLQVITITCVALLVGAFVLFRRLRWI